MRLISHSHQLYTHKNDGAKKVEIWRASATYLKKNPEKATINEPYCKGIHPLTFNEMQHKSLCAELKYLYTVATRAKYHLWIFEDLPPESLPMLDYWHRRDVIQIKKPSELAKQLHINSTPTSDDDWRRRGEELDKEEIWREAEKCYTKAKEPLLAKQAHIKLILKEAKEKKSKKERNNKLRMAAAGFLACDEMRHNTSYLKDFAYYVRSAEMYEYSAKIYEKLHEVSNNNAIKPLKYGV